MKTQFSFCWTLLLGAISANEIQYGKTDHQGLAMQSKQIPYLQSTPACVDNHLYCPPWALAGECLINPNYMLTACRKSCNQCVAAPNALLIMAREIAALKLSLAELERSTSNTTTSTTTCHQGSSHCTVLHRISL